MGQPVWEVGDYWVYFLREGPAVTGTMRMAVTGTDSVTVSGITYPSYRLAVMRRMTWAGMFPLYRNESGASWYRTSDFAFVKTWLNGTEESPQSGRVAISTVREFSPPQSIQWPLVYGNAWYESGWVNESSTYGGSPPTWSNSSLVQWFGVLSAGNTGTAAGSFATTPVQGTWGSAYENVTWWSSVAGNVVESVERIYGSEVRSSSLIAYQHRAGAPDTTDPVISGVVAMPPAVSQYGVVTVQADIADDVAVAGASINLTLPDGMFYTDALTKGTGTSYSFLWPALLFGTHLFTIWATDSSGNAASRSGSFVAKRDAAPPVIASAAASPKAQIPGGTVNISATVTDDVWVSDVFVNVTLPNGTHVNRTMTRVGNDFYDATKWTEVGDYRFTVWAIDVSGKVASATGSFTVGSRPALDLGVVAIAAVIVVAIAVTAGLLVRRRRKRLTGGPPPRP